jgi:chemotaxis methyl-accepting protein methylase
MMPERLGTTPERLGTTLERLGTTPERRGTTLDLLTMRETWYPRRPQDFRSFGESASRSYQTRETEGGASPRKSRTWLRSSPASSACG